MASATPNLTKDLIRIHKVVTRSLEVCLARGLEYLKSGSSLTEGLQGFANYTHCFASVLSSHHQGEDLIAFPAFQKVISSAPYQQLADDHRQIEKFLTSIPPAVIELSGGVPENGLQVIIDTLTKISEVWYPHIRLEENTFSKGTMNKVLTPEEQGNISAASSKYSQEHSGPPYWIIPFILFNLNNEDRTAMAAGIPPMITEELVPKVWKDQWASMKPYLLD